MHRKDILTICENIMELLKKEKEISVNGISYRLRSQRNTIVKCLEFLKKINIVDERREKAVRYFYLKKK